ncbi:SDR family NAD(P)-dependent oxidoreductase [Immundisolibacter sp.]|uniref:SDR family NAD(P)-dependent oxidoreductase n=1 Tax=Immundisolibacter sp. TaxID=1934948 RepID=UPI000ED68F64|nr:short-chain dehydrogenase [Gammaproteobacteria bacterium]
MDLGYSGMSVVVTGAASNIGRAIALGFAAEGARVTIGDIDAGQADRVAQAACAAGGLAQAVATDVTDLAQVRRLFAAAESAHGAVKVLVNAVGWDQLMYFTETTPEFWDTVIRINYVGVLNCTRTALDSMLHSGGGSIVSISSDASRQGEPREAVYGGVKAAINSFMKTIAKENGRFGVRCNVVCPGVTLPEAQADVGERSMWAGQGAMFTDEQLEKIARALPLKKIGKPQDIANAVLFLASDRVAGHITGQVLSVSGGYSMAG